MPPVQPALPPDFGPRIRAAAAYTGLGLKEFANKIGAPGASYSTLRKYVEQGHRPAPLAQGALVQRLAEASGLPESFFLGEAAAAPDLSRIADEVAQLRAETAVRDLEAHAQLDEVAQAIRRLQPPPRQ